MTCTFNNQERGHLTVDVEGEPDVSTHDIELPTSKDADGVVVSEGGAGNGGGLLAAGGVSGGETGVRGWWLTGASCVGEVDGAIVESARPQKRRRHVHVRMRRIDAEIRAIDAVAEHLVAHHQRRPILGNRPAERVVPGERQPLPIGP